MIKESSASPQTRVRGPTAEEAAFALRSGLLFYTEVLLGIKQHTRVARQRPEVLVDQFFGLVSGGAQAVHGGDDLVVEGLPAAHPGPTWPARHPGDRWRR